MELEALRAIMDEVDRELCACFQRRMEVAARIGALKRTKGLDVLDRDREREKLGELVRLVTPEMAPHVTRLYELLFEMSREYQENLPQEGRP